MDHERLMDDIAAHYILITQQHPGLSPDELVTLIVDRVDLDAELRMATAEQPAGSHEGWVAIQRFVSRDGVLRRRPRARRPRGERPTSWLRR